MHPSRLTAIAGQPVTIFLIGMRINTPHRLDHWGPVMKSFPKMLHHLETHATPGYLGSHLWLGRTTISLQYWDNPEDLQAFAADSDAPHLAPWRNFRHLGAEGHVGIWHETYVVEPSGIETIYVNMPSFGLGEAIGTTTVGAGLQTARQRLRATTAR